MSRNLLKWIATSDLGVNIVTLGGVVWMMAQLYFGVVTEVQILKHTVFDMRGDLDRMERRMRADNPGYGPRYQPSDVGSTSG